MNRHKLISVIAGFIFITAGCSSQQTKSEANKSVNSQTKLLPTTLTTTPTETKKTKESKLNLDAKALLRVNEAFRAVIQNDDKKAKLTFGRSYKYMPEFIQFAFDLRFRNFDHAKDLTSKLPYNDDEKTFWQNLISKKPASITKYMCEEFKKTNFEVPQLPTHELEMPWYQDLQEVMDELYSKEMSKTGNKATIADETFSKVKYKNEKGEIIPLSIEAQKDLLQDSFFDKVRNAQRKDTLHWLDTYKTPLKAWTYQRLFNPHLAFQFYESLMATTQIEAHKKSHFERRMRGIIKDMRVETARMRSIADAVIKDQKDLKISTGIENFLSRYPILTIFLNLESNLAECGLKKN
jgi:hypothetical protein